MARDPEDRPLQGIQVIDLAGEAGALTGRILADLGADVLRPELPSGDPLRQSAPCNGAGESMRYRAWSVGKKVIRLSNASEIEDWLAGADIVLETPGATAFGTLDPKMAPRAAWIRMTPFGAVGPRASWRATDIGILAATGNLFATGDPDRPPVRCSEPVAYAHAGPEAAFAALSALASGRPQLVDLSMQETVLSANMGGPGNFPRSGDIGTRKGAVTGRTREIWPCADGYVSFGLRGGRARLQSLEILAGLLRDEGLSNSAWEERDWLSYDAKTADESELRSLEEPLAALFLRRSMRAWYELACETNLMLAPAAGPDEILSRTQNQKRQVFHSQEDLRGLPARIALWRPGPGATHIPIPEALPPSPRGRETGRPPSGAASAPGASTGCWEGLRVVEFGSGAAGRIAARYFAENGATVIKIESRERPDFLRAMWAQASPHGLEGSPLFNALNPGKKSITLDLKSTAGLAQARALIQWSDLVLENFAPRAMKGFGLDFDSLVADRPDLLMISTCLNGQTGPHRNYPGFGGQGSALAGYNYLTGWPDREPLGPYGTITDSLAPRFTATLAGAALLQRRRTGRGGHYDLAQVEAAEYALGPWLLAYAQTGASGERRGNRHPDMAPHGVFPTRGKDRWIAIACSTDAQWAALAATLDLGVHNRATAAERLADAELLEHELAKATESRDAEAIAARLQAQGVEAVPVADFGDVFRDETLQARDHFQTLEHPVLGECFYERNGFRLSGASGGYRSPTPLLGQHDDELAEILADMPEQTDPEA